MNISKLIAIAVLLLLCSNVIAQNQKKLDKHMTYFVNKSFDPTAPIAFDKKNPDKHGFEKVSGAFELAFTAEAFKVKPPVAKPRYLVVIDYDYGYAIANYKMQYSNIKAQVLDLENNSEVVGGFTYIGRYENDVVAQAMAEKFKGK